ncbi:multiprotein-bridging factor 1 family protein [Streptomyces sp. NPDC059783]|uniref:helix-turn-helix domain-containing protein n=1 Tax=Streptomyces sp. NPDC059783 TaxID=3346944 RepID=UPI0036658C83
MPRARARRGLSLRALAEKLGYPHTYLSRVERGEQLPSEALAEALDVFYDASARSTRLSYASAVLGHHGRSGTEAAGGWCGRHG